MNAKKAKRLYKAAKAEADGLRLELEGLKGQLLASKPLLPKLFELTADKATLRDLAQRRLDALGDLDGELDAMRELLAEREKDLEANRKEVERLMSETVSTSDHLVEVDRWRMRCQALEAQNELLRDALTASHSPPLSKTIHNTHPIITGSGKVSPFYVARGPLKGGAAGSAGPATTATPLKGGAAGGQGQGRAVRTFDGHDAYCPKAQDNDLEAECICRRTVDPTD